jgi:hypothetical protein
LGEVRIRSGFRERVPKLAASGLGQRGAFELNMGERLSNLRLERSAADSPDRSWTCWHPAGGGSSTGAVNTIKERSDYAGEQAV